MTVEKEGSAGRKIVEGGRAAAKTAGTAGRKAGNAVKEGATKAGTKIGKAFSALSAKLHRNKDDKK